MKQAQQFAWPFNLNIPRAFSFPALGTVEWLALAFWNSCKGDAIKIPNAERIRAGAQLKWKDIWGEIYSRYSFQEPAGQIPNTTHFSMKHPEGWVQTLLDAERFWLVEINVWPMQMVKKEFEEINGRSLATCPFISDTKQCEHLCRRFHAYQQARYRWHEHLLEKHCERALGKRDKNPQTGLEARACLIGWLSQQRGYARHPLVAQFTRRKPRPNEKQQRFFFNKERCAPSYRRYRITNSAPSRPDEMGWLILTWPIWNFYDWQWAQVGSALIEQFRSVDAKGKQLDFWPNTMKRMQKSLRKHSDASGSMPAEQALSLFYQHFSNPTPKEAEMHKDWERTVRRPNSKAVEKLCRLAIGRNLEKQIEPRPRRRGLAKKPSLWDFARQISA